VGVTLLVGVTDTVAAIDLVGVIVGDTVGVTVGVAVEVGVAEGLGAIKAWNPKGTNTIPSLINEVPEDVYSLFAS